ncbi:RagB/SusD family nutrient uptake outer membrane protein [Pedobacter sp. KBW01]|uniref:RagB/SusD family nutrient uptake outer membrane protein n=1 Tax=Pedobacter sp. KBW01 TaxID=2153364 RepID=UPI000F5A568D|nr:RagB/SusD family nutrient uptake outer membrane protein [Pedobacter sp. KBW01]RQO76675.1 RagB/SusD family nutrient uptake outer membrane protein [Pedobacter sp. KBW01]
MKKNLFIIAMLGICIWSCKKLDLNPLSSPSTSSFYSNQVELELAVNDLYRLDFWAPIKENTGAWEEFFSDNCYYRGGSGSNPVIAGTQSSSDAFSLTFWTNAYKAIARVNAFLENKDRAAASTPATVMTTLEAEMRLIRAYQYSKLITHYGDVPLNLKILTLEESYNVKKSSKADIYNFLKAEFDFAAQNLPQNYASSSIKRLTKGAALALKARTALYMGDWETAREAALAVMNLTGAGAYSLNNSYSALFQRAGELSPEIILGIPRDQAQKVSATPDDILSRNAGGFGATMPTRELVDAYECTDGKPINESPLYNPLNPFANRDPRLAATVVPFNTYWLGYNYNPHPDSLQVWSSKLARKATNNDSRGVAPFASFTGFLFKKGVEQSWSDTHIEDNDAIIVRFAEMLLTYAEAKIELGQLDASVLEAINRVRARGYGVAATSIGSYPAITTLDPVQLKKIVRRERRIEFAFEGLRYMDLIRWKLAERALNKPIIALPDPANQNRAKWPFPGITPIDADGIADYSGFGSDVKIQFVRKFDATKQYLWPIPQQEVRLNPSLTQNPNY